MIASSDAESAQSRIAELDWWHTIEVAPGVVTAGRLGPARHGRRAPLADGGAHRPPLPRHRDDGRLLGLRARTARCRRGARHRCARRGAPRQVPRRPSPRAAGEARLGAELRARRGAARITRAAPRPQCLRPRPGRRRPVRPDRDGLRAADAARSAAGSGSRAPCLPRPADPAGHDQPPARAPPRAARPPGRAQRRERVVRVQPTRPAQGPRAQRLGRRADDAGPARPNRLAPRRAGASARRARQVQTRRPWPLSRRTRAAAHV